MNLLPTSSGIKQKNVNQIKQTMLVCPSDFFFFFSLSSETKRVIQAHVEFFFSLSTEGDKKRETRENRQ